MRWRDGSVSPSCGVRTESRLASDRQAGGAPVAARTRCQHNAHDGRLRGWRGRDLDGRAEGFAERRAECAIVDRRYDAEQFGNGRRCDGAAVSCRARCGDGEGESKRSARRLEAAVGRGAGIGERDERRVHIVLCGQRARDRVKVKGRARNVERDLLLHGGDRLRDRRSANGHENRP